MFLTQNNEMKWRLLSFSAVVVAVTVALGITFFDAPVLLFMREFDCRFWRILSAIFDDKVWFCVFAFFVGYLYVKKSVISGWNFKNSRNRFSILVAFRDFLQKTMHSHVFLIFCSILMTSVVAGVLKVFIGRARPILFEALEFTGFYPPSIDWVFNSMPSGHTAVSFAALVMIGMLAPQTCSAGVAPYFCGRYVKPVVWTLAIMIGVARVCVGAHWPTDVILGAFIGMVVADLVKWFFMRRTVVTSA